MLEKEKGSQKNGCPFAVPERNNMKNKDTWLEYLEADVKPVKLGNTNRTGKCGMCGIKVKRLYPKKVGSVQFYICPNCLSIMNMR